MATGSGLALLEERLAAKSATPGTAFIDPTIIITIITALIPLIQQCFKPKPASLRRRLGNRGQVAAALRGKGLGWIEAFTAANQLFDVADESKDEEIQAVIDDCLSA